MSDAHDDLIDTLRGVSEAIDDRVLQLLREAVAEGSGDRPQSERHLSQARRAVEKAIHALERAGEPSAT